MHDMVTKVFILPDGARDFLLSDDPIARSDGWKKDDGHFAIPISPRRLFVSTWTKQTMNMIEAMPAHNLVTAMNTQTVEGARHFVASTDLKQDRFIRNRFGKKPRDSIYGATLLD